MNYEAASQYILERLKTELPGYCSYHDFGHTIDVLNAVEFLASREGVSDAESLGLLRTAAVYHDCGFIFQYKANEPVAADLARRTLPQFGYTEEQIGIIEKLILVTALGAEPTNTLEKIIKDADFDYLGRNEYTPFSMKLKAEWEHVGMHFTMPEWYSLQKKFLESHRYYTRAANEIREPVKQQHLEAVKALAGEQN